MNFVQYLSDRIIREGAFQNIDIDMIRVLLYLQTRDPLFKSLVVKWLRCEVLAPRDEETLGGLASRSRDEDPTRMLEQLGRVMAASGGAAMVVCVDQLEDVYNLEDVQGRFRLAVSALRGLIDDVPNSVVVVACLEEYYLELRQYLDRASLDRVESSEGAAALVTTVCPVVLVMTS